MDCHDSAMTPWASPVLRWAGSKRQLLPRLLHAIPKTFGRYVEPFAGSATLFFALRPSLAVLGDLNSELVQAYTIIKRHPRIVHRGIASLPNTARYYYRSRSVSPHLLTPMERAVRFVYLNRFCFNGVYRTNRRNEFNVPRGKSTGALPSEASFYRVSVALRNADLRAGDFVTTLSDLRPSDFVYLDPPYDTGRRRHGEYGYGSFSAEDFGRLVELLQWIDKVGAMFLLSYADTSPVRGLTGQWRQQRVRVRRHVAGFARHRSTVRELLVSNY